MLLVCYDKCSTCKSVEKMLKDRGVDFEIRDIKKDNPSSKELKEWHEKSGIDISKFYNTGGLQYREKNIKEKRSHMSLEEQYDLLSKDGMLVKRPILIAEDKIYIGPMVKKYIESI